MPNTKPKKPSRRKTKRNLGDEILAGLTDATAFFQGKPNSITVTRAVPEPIASFIRRAKARRLAQGLSITVVSKLAGVPRETISRLESESVSNPGWKLLSAYAEALGCRMEIKISPR